MHCQCVHQMSEQIIPLMLSILTLLFWRVLTTQDIFWKLLLASNLVSRHTQLVWFVNFLFIFFSAVTVDWPCLPKRYFGDNWNRLLQATFLPICPLTTGFRALNWTQRSNFTRGKWPSGPCSFLIHQLTSDGIDVILYDGFLTAAPHIQPSKQYN